MIDPATRKKIADFDLKGHPEGFQIADTRTQVFVNVPDLHQIQIVDLMSGVVRSLPTDPLRANFPMAIDREAHRVLIVFRSPPTLVALSSPDEKIVAKQETCGDADDVFVDAKRHRVYVACGAGQVDVFEERAASYQRIGHVGTAPGARTALFVPEMDRLFVAVRAAAQEPAAVWVFRPVP